MSDSSNWKSSEKKAAETYRKFNLPAVRETRGADFSRKDYEVKIYLEGNPIEVVTDSKYSKAAPFKVHGLVKEIKAKYCPQKNQIPVLYTRNYKEVGAYFTVEEKIFAGLLGYFLGTVSKEEVLGVWGVL